jgi:hypothetical protein
MPATQQLFDLVALDTSLLHVFYVWSYNKRIAIESENSPRLILGPDVLNVATADADGNLLPSALSQVS